MFYRTVEEINMCWNQNMLTELKEKYKEKLNIFFRYRIEKYWWIVAKFKERTAYRAFNNGAGEPGYFEDISYGVEKRMIDINIIALIKFTKYFYGKTEFKYIFYCWVFNGDKLMTGYYATKSFYK